MSRDLSTDNENASLANIVRPALFAEFDFESGWLRVWSGVGEATTLSRTFAGIGAFGRVGAITEPEGLSAAGCSFQLTGIPSSLVGSALSENYRDRPCRLWMGFFDPAGAIIDNPFQIYAGRMDFMEISDDPDTLTSTLTIQTENRLVDFRRPRVSRYTHEEQIRRFPGDLFFQYIARLAERPIYWGVPGSTGNPSYG